MTPKTVLIQPAVLESVGWEKVAKLLDSIGPIDVEFLPGIERPRDRYPDWRAWEEARWDEMLGVTPRHKFVRALMRPLSSEELRDIPMGIGY